MKRSNAEKQLKKRQEDYEKAPAKDKPALTKPGSIKKK